jgi:GNAT superfamily N-acetyltransferase
LPEQLPGFPTEKYKQYFSLRQRGFLHHSNQIELCNLKNIKIIDLKMENINQIKNHFNILTRFWKNENQFLKYARAKVLLYKDNVAAICYAAACDKETVELDIMTLPEYRNIGLGKVVGSHFIYQCQQEKLNVYWDCFINNIGSVKLAESFNFLNILSKYSLLTVDRKDFI